MANGNPIAAKDIVIVDNLNLTELEDDICRLITKNTSNTWQQGRSLESKYQDTKLGKLAEKAVKNFLNEGSYDKFNPLLAFYDEFRTDKFKKHNSIDFVFSKNINCLLKAEKHIQEKMFSNEILDENLDIANHIRLSELKTFVGEIKSTRVAQRHKGENNQTDLTRLLSDDFLTYPKFLRNNNGVNVYNTKQYLDYIKRTRRMDEESIKKAHENYIADWQIRVYIENVEDSYTAYIIGAVPKHQFIDSFNIKKMGNNDKSEFALYLSVPLRNGMSMEEFKSNEIPSLPYRNHLSSAINNNSDLIHLLTANNIQRNRLKP